MHSKPQTTSRKDSVTSSPSTPEHCSYPKAESSGLLGQMAQAGPELETECLILWTRGPDSDGCIDTRSEGSIWKENADQTEPFDAAADFLAAALIAVGCGSNATDERSVEDYSDTGVETDEQPDPGLPPESTADDETTEEAGDDEEAHDAPRPSLPSDPALHEDADDSPPAFFDDLIIAADLWGAELAILSGEWDSTG